MSQTTDDLPPSAQFVRSKLVEVRREADTVQAAERTRAEVEELTGLKRRTTQYALRVLVEREDVEKRPSMGNVSKPAYVAVCNICASEEV